MESPTDFNNEIVLIIGSAGMLLLTFAIASFIYLYQRKLIKKQLAFQEIESLLKKQELNSTYNFVEGQEMERKRIAQELHDNIGSMLVTLNMYSDTAINANEIQQKNEFIQKVNNIATKANEEIRKLSHQLDSASLRHFGLKSAISDLCQVVNETQKLKAECLYSIEREMKSEISLNLYRIIQELINNTLKHSGATAIFIELNQKQHNYIKMIYRDNGIGLKDKKEDTGMGMTSIRARIDKLNGEMNIEPIQKGFCLTAEIPLL